MLTKFFDLEKPGFIKHWLVNDKPLKAFSINERHNNQLTFEKMMREKTYNEYVGDIPNLITINKTEKDSTVWKYHNCDKNWFVDNSDFYSLPVKVERWLYTELYSEDAKNIDVTLWTYTASCVWLNDKKIDEIKEPVYKPINSKTITLSLNKGINKLLVQMQNLGVRDTRNIFGVQILDFLEVTTTLPNIESISDLIDMQMYFEQVTVKGKTITCNSLSPLDFNIKPLNIEIKKQSEQYSFLVPDDISLITLSSNFNNQEIIREIEIIENIKPVYIDKNLSEEEAKSNLFLQMSKKETQPRGNDMSFSIYYVLSRYFLNTQTEKDEELILEDLRLIDSRIDCSDFLVVGILRLYKKYDLSEKLNKKIKETLLNYRYWMDEDGDDGMCFWSENHSLMFYGSLLVASELFSDELFKRSNKLGKDQHAIAYKKCEQWVDDIAKDGFEEFISAGYMCVTVAALLNIVDFADSNLSKKATIVMDELLTQLSSHTFKGSVIGPQGRVYRDVIYPHTQGVQSLIHYINHETPFAEDMWISTFATSKYVLPTNLKQLMQNDFVKTYACGNSNIVVNKNKDFMLTSVMSPRDLKECRVWENISFDKNPDMSCYLFTKSINECYHGTTWFQPGNFGYQQHLWYAALDQSCVVFTNHPGGTYDRSHMRPGYWYGNGILPTVSQKDNVLMCIYSIPKSYPIHFTHLFFPISKFDNTVIDGYWIFGQKLDGYLGIWCSGEPVLHNDIIIDSEFRVYDSDSAYVCVCSSKDKYHDFDSFQKFCLDNAPLFDKKTLELSFCDDMISFKQTETNIY